MIELIFYVSVGFGQVATGGPVIYPQRFNTVEACESRAALYKQVLESKMDWHRCIKVPQ